MGVENSMWSQSNKRNEENAFTGLEAAIVLIAFVVVAAVFSYALIGSGFFASAKTQEATAAGIKQTTSNVIIDGYLYGTMDSGKLKSLNFLISVPEGNEPSSVDGILYVYSHSGNAPQEIHAFYPNGEREVSANRTVEVVLDNLGGPEPGGTFTLELKPRFGSSLFLTRKLADGYTGGVLVTA
jgi:flagellin FlaB